MTESNLSSSRVSQEKQSGFTLIELMIVVAIIGILAAIAIPAYQDYTIRARVSESASITSSLRTATGVLYSEDGSLPVNLDSLADYVTTDASQYQTKYVASISVDNGQIIARMRDRTDLGGARNGTVVWNAITEFSAAVDWEILDSSTVPPKYRPRAQ